MKKLLEQLHIATIHEKVNITTPDLMSVDVESLDPVERHWYENLHIKNPGMTKEEILQVIINTSEGDFTQLSDKLRARAEKDTTFKNEAKESTMKKVKEGKIPDLTKDSIDAVIKALLEHKDRLVIKEDVEATIKSDDKEIAIVAVSGGFQITVLDTVPDAQNMPVEPREPANVGLEVTPEEPAEAPTETAPEPEAEEGEENEGRVADTGMDEAAKPDYSMGGSFAEGDEVIVTGKDGKDVRGQIIEIKPTSEKDIIVYTLRRDLDYGKSSKDIDYRVHNGKPDNFKSMRKDIGGVGNEDASEAVKIMKGLR